MDAEQINAICDELAMGKSLRRICREKGMKESTVRWWLQRDPESFAHSARARELGCDALADECIDIADDDGDPADKRIRIDTRIRLIGKWSQRYGDKLNVKSESEVTHRYDLDGLTDVELDQLEQLATKAAQSVGDTGR